MEISYRPFTKIMAFILIFALAGCSNIFSTPHPAPERDSLIIPSTEILPEKSSLVMPRAEILPEKPSLIMPSVEILPEKPSRILSGAEILPRIFPWFRSYENADMKLSSDDNHTMEFAHWLEKGLLLDGKNTKFKYDQKKHYQIGNRGPAIISDVYYVYEIEKIYSLLEKTEAYWPDDVVEVVAKIQSGAVKINRGVIHWHRHHEKLKARSKFKLTETYYMTIYVESQDGDIPVLEITHNSIARYKRDSLSSDVERLFSKAESTDGLFRAPDSVVVDWQEIPETIGISRKNIFWVAADLEASRSTETIYYFTDGTDPLSNLDLFLLYSPDQHAGNVLTEFLNVIWKRGQRGLTTFTAETIDGSNHSEYFHRDDAWIEVDAGNSGIAMPDEDGEAFNTFLQFLHVSIPGMVSYVGGGKFSVITQPLGALVIENVRGSSPPAGSAVVAIDLMQEIGAPDKAIRTGALAARAVANYGDYQRKQYTESAENQTKLAALNRAGSLCSQAIPPGKAPASSSSQRISDCRECLASSETYDNFADGARDGFVYNMLSEAAIITTQGVALFGDYAENEAYIDSTMENGATSGCFNLI